MSYEILSHTADLKIKATGKDLPEVFVNVALAVGNQQSPKASKGQIKDEPWQEIMVQSSDLSSLLVDWLNEILYQGEANQKVYLDFEVTDFCEKPACIKARIRGLPAKTKDIEIKAATYHNLAIEKTKDGWEVVVVLDI